MPKDTRDVADVMTDPATAATGKTAVLYRMALPNHLCPSGQKARWLLKSKGYDIDDRLFRERPEVDAFKEEYDVPTTPQVWIDGERVGGYDALRQKLTDYDPGATTYRPVIYLFAVAAATALALSIGFLGAITWQTLGWFISVSMILLGMQKLRDIESFSTMWPCRKMSRDRGSGGSQALYRCARPGRRNGSNAVSYRRRGASR